MREKGANDVKVVTYANISFSLQYRLQANTIEKSSWENIFYGGCKMTESGDMLSNEIITLNYSPVVLLSTVLNRRVMIIFRSLAIYSLFFLCCDTLFLSPIELGNGLRWYSVVMSIPSILILWGFGNVTRRGKYTKTLIVVMSAYLAGSLLYYVHLALLYFFNSIPYAIFSPVRIGDISLRTVALIYILLCLRKVRAFTRSRDNVTSDVDEPDLIKNTLDAEDDSSSQSRLIWIAALAVGLMFAIKLVGYPFLQIMYRPDDWFMSLFGIPDAIIFGLFCLLAIRSGYLKILLLICLFAVLDNVFFFKRFLSLLDNEFFFKEFSEDRYLLAFALRMAHMIFASIASVCLGIKCLRRFHDQRHAVD